MSFVKTIVYGLLLRFCISIFADFLDYFDGVNILNSYNSWINAKEGIKLYKLGVDPYDGDVFHENPIDLRLFYIIENYFNPFVPCIFMFVQIITSILLYKIGQHIAYYYKEACNKNDTINFPKVFFALYYLNPIIIIMCITQSTTSFVHVLICSLLYSALQGNLIVCSLCLATLQLHHYHAMILMIPTALLINLYNTKIDDSKSRWEKITKQSAQVIEGELPAWALTLSLLFLITLAFTIFLFVLCFHLGGTSYGIGSWKFLANCLVDKFYVTDYTPNLGMSWYTFAESFPHFHSFFVWIFRIPCFIYVIPLSIKYRSDPLFLFYVLLLVLFAFDPYPNIGDMCLALSLAPTWASLFPYMRSTLVYGFLFLASVIVSPVVWCLWIYADSANANFYYAMSLLYTLAQIFFTSDLLFAHNFKAFVRLHGIKSGQSQNLERKILGIDDIDRKFPF